MTSETLRYVRADLKWMQLELARQLTCLSKRIDVGKMGGVRFRLKSFNVSR